MEDAEIETLADAVVAKLAEGLYRMPDELREAVKSAGGYGYFSAPGTLMPSPNAYYLTAVVRTDGIQIEIKSPDGRPIWRAVLL